MGRFVEETELRLSPPSADSARPLPPPNPPSHSTVIALARRNGFNSNGKISRRISSSLLSHLVSCNIDFLFFISFLSIWQLPFSPYRNVDSVPLHFIHMSRYARILSFVAPVSVLTCTRPQLTVPGPYPSRSQPHPTPRYPDVPVPPLATVHPAQYPYSPSVPSIQHHTRTTSPYPAVS